MSKECITTADNHSECRKITAYSKYRDARNCVTLYSIHTLNGACIDNYDIDIPPDYNSGIAVTMTKYGGLLTSWIYSGYKPGFRCFDTEGNLVWGVATFDLERAIKVVNEKRTQILALNLWGKQNLNSKLPDGVFNE